MGKYIGTLVSGELLHCHTIFGYSPQRLRHRRWVVEVVLWKRRPQRISCFFGVVVGHCRAEMVRDVGAADVVVQEVDDVAVGAVDGLERAFHPGVVVLVEVSYVHV